MIVRFDGILHISPSSLGDFLHSYGPLNQPVFEIGSVFPNYNPFHFPETIAFSSQWFQILCLVFAVKIV